MRLELRISNTVYFCLTSSNLRLVVVIFVLSHIYVISNFNDNSTNEETKKRHENIDIALEAGTGIPIYPLWRDPSEYIREP